MRWIWQYQQKFEPVATTGETIPADKWFRPTAQPVLPPRHLNGGSIVFEPVVADGAAPPVSQWSQPASQPVLRARQPALGGSVLVEVVEPPAEDVTLDMWFQPASQPVRQWPRLAGGFGVGPLEPSLFVEPDFDSWFRPASQPVLPARRLQPPAQPVYQPEPDLFPELIPVDLASFYRQTSTPVLPARQPNRGPTFFYPGEPGSTFGSEPATTTLDTCCGGMPRVPDIRYPPVTVAPLVIPLPDGKKVTVQPQVSTDPNLVKAIQLLAHVSTHDLLDLETRVKVKPVVGKVTSIQDDTIQVSVGDITVTVAKPPSLRVSQNPDLAGMPTYTVGQTITATAIEGGNISGEANPGTGPGTGIANVVYQDINVDGTNAAQVTGLTTTTGGETYVSAVSCTSGSLSVTTDTLAELGFENGLLKSVGT